MKIVPLFLLAIFIMPIFLSCNPQKTPKEVAYQTIVDSFGKGKDIVKVEMTDFDSAFLYFHDDPIYDRAEDSMYSYKHKLHMELLDYKFNLKHLGWSGKSMIEYYQECIKDDLKVINNIHQTYKKKFVGYKSVFYLQYQTDFNDSLIIGISYLTPKNNKIYECNRLGKLELGQVWTIHKDYKYAENPDSLIVIMHKQYDQEIPPATVDTTDFIH